jgi:hypothetical protein
MINQGLLVHEVEVRDSIDDRRLAEFQDGKIQVELKDLVIEAVVL